MSAARSYPRAGSSPGAATRFQCRTPDGYMRYASVPNGHLIKEPIALFYREDANWLFRAIIDRRAMPAWARNYRQTVAQRV